MKGYTDQVAKEEDRNLYLVGAQPKDSEESDLSEDDGDDETVAGAMKKGRAGSKDEDEGGLSDVDDEILDSMGEGDEDDENEAGKVQASDEDLDEEETTYKRRFADTKADRDEKVKILKQTMQENARLKALQSLDSDVNEEELTREIQEGIYRDISAIDEKDPTKRTKAAYDAVGRGIARATKKAVDLALNRMASVQEESIRETEQQTAARGRAEKMAKIVMKEEGLNPDKHFSLFQEEVDKQMADDPDWFKAIPADQHFIKLTSRVKARVEANQKANANHQREAQGQVNRGSRVTQKPARQTDDDQEDTNTMRGAMLLSRQRNLMRGKRAFQYR